MVQGRDAFAVICRALKFDLDTDQVATIVGSRAPTPDSMADNESFASPSPAATFKILVCFCVSLTSAVENVVWLQM